MTLALITSGGRRLGAVITARLADHGYDIALHSRMPGEPESWLAEHLDKSGVHWECVDANFAEPDAVDHLLDQIRDKFGASPSILVNNASHFLDEEANLLSIDSLIDHFRINAAVPAVLAQNVAHANNAVRKCVIINILDQRIANPHSDQMAYTASKMALAGMTEMLSRALAPGARVNAVAPGLTIPGPLYSAAQIERLTSMMPLAQLPTAANVADAVLYLIGAEATTGQTIYVDGGAHQRSFDRDFLNLARD